MAPIHDRMPVILPPTAWDTWLDPANQDLVELGGLLVPAPANLLTMHTISTDVNNVRNRGEHLIDEAPPLEPQPEPAPGRGLRRLRRLRNGIRRTPRSPATPTR